MSSRGKMYYPEDRYFWTDVISGGKIGPEGIEGQGRYRSLLSAVVHQLIGGVAQLTS